MTQHNYIPVKSLNNIRVLYGRYAIVVDANSVYRVVSLVRSPARELQPSDAQGGLSYSFDERGTGYKTNFGQRSLKHMADDRGSTPNDVQLRFLTERGVVTVINDVKMSNVMRGDLDGLPTPINNRLLHPVNGGWVIGTVTVSGIDFSSQPKVHHSRPEAVTELGRLAKGFAGTEFVLFKVDMTATAVGVQTKTFQ
jgi:hypothetical protein